MEKNPDDAERRKDAWAEALAELFLVALFLGGAWLLLQKWSWMFFLAVGIFLMVGLPALFLLLERRAARKSRGK